MGDLHFCGDDFLFLCSYVVIWRYRRLDYSRNKLCRYLNSAYIYEPAWEKVEISSPLFDSNIDSCANYMVICVD